MRTRQFNELLLPHLRLPSDGGEYTLAVLRGPTTHDSSWTDAEPAELFPSRTQAPFVNRLCWSKVQFERAGHVARVPCFVFAASNAGLACRSPWTAAIHHVARAT
jgi:hypothetical protein